jgi:hypothetical protein
MILIHILCEILLLLLLWKNYERRTYLITKQLILLLLWKNYERRTYLITKQLKKIKSSSSCSCGKIMREELI